MSKVTVSSVVKFWQWRLRSRDIGISILLFCISCFLLVMCWVLAAASLNGEFSLSTLLSLHEKQPLLFLVDLFPFGVALGFLFVQSQNAQLIHQLEEQNAAQSLSIEEKADFATAIGDGRYDASLELQGGERDRLGTSLLRMRDNLLENTQKENEHSWVAKGKEDIAYVLRMYTNLQELGYEVLKKLVAYINVVQGGLFLYDEEKERLLGLATYAYNREKLNHLEFAIGEGLVGQCAYERGIIHRTEIPEDYVSITSGILGDARPKSILLVPLITDERLQGVIEFASIQGAFSERDIRFLEEVGETIARVVFNLRISQKTEALLHEAQQMTTELRANEDLLRQNAEEMQKTHEELERSNIQLEAKIKEAENAQKRLHSLLENASEVITIYSKEKSITYISPSVTTILGYTPQEMMDGKDRERLTQEGVRILDEMFEELISTPHEAVTCQYIFMKKDGVKVFMEVTGRNLLEDPAIRGLILNSRDITERLRAEKEERMKSKMQSLSENSVDMIVRLDPEGQFFYANPIVARFFGVSVAEVVDKNLLEVGMPDVLRESISNAIHEVVSTQEKWEQEVSIERDEEKLILKLLAIPEFDEGQLETILLVGHDVTEAKRIENEIQEKSHKIQESINYAKRIQSSILPDVKLIQQYFPKSFMYYRPRDVVSGDFPWIFVKGDNIYIAAVDCTGHGVPGALLSFIGFFTLNNVVDHDASYSAGKVLDLLHAGVRKTLRQERADADARDGMDIALCKIDLKQMHMEYAGAHRPLYFVREASLEEYKGDRRAIGGIPNARKPEGEFTNYSLDLKPGDRIFFFSDGLPDQQGGESGQKKYSPQHIREVLVEQRELSMARLAQFIEEDFLHHRGVWKQMDDVLLIGIEF